MTHGVSKPTKEGSVPIAGSEIFNAPHQPTASAVSALALTSVAVGAFALGALAIGALAIGRLAIGKARIRRMTIDELVVRNLRVTGDLQGLVPVSRKEA